MELMMEICVKEREIRIRNSKGCPASQPFLKFWI